MAARPPPFISGSYQMGPPPQYIPGRQGMPAVNVHHPASRSNLPMTTPPGSRLSAHHSSSSLRTDSVRKRLAESVKSKTAHHQHHHHQQQPQHGGKVFKRRKLGDKMLSHNIRDLVPESQAYMDLLAFEKKLDSTIMRKRLEMQEAMKRPSQMKQQRKLRVFLTHKFIAGVPPKGNNSEGGKVPEWELKIGGRLLDESCSKPDDNVKAKFSTFFRSVIIELDKDSYGPDNHLIEWHRTSATNEEIDGFTVTRPGEDSVKSTVILALNHQPSQYKLSSKLAKLLGIHTASKVDIVNGIWQYIKNNRLQDPQEREFINNDKYFQQALDVDNSTIQRIFQNMAKLFECPRMKFTEIPRKLVPLLMAPDPIVIHHLINADAPDGKRTACYDLDVEIDDPVQVPMQSFMMSSVNHQEIVSLDAKIHETVDQINAIKLQRDFYLGFAHHPQKFINDWLASQSRDLKIMKDKVGNPEHERRSDYYKQAWSDEAVPRYFYAKVTQQKQQLEHALGIRH